MQGALESAICRYASRYRRDPGVYVVPMVALFLDCVAVLSCTYGEIERNEGKVPTEWYWCGIALHAER